MHITYVPELDATKELGTDDIRFYQEMIGMLHWATELGRVDVLHEISILSQYQASPREGHLEQLIHIFAYLEKKPRLSLYMDPDLPVFPADAFSTTSNEFKEYYCDADELMPHKMP